MRVALLVTDHERGGTPLRVARLARRLHDAGVEVHAGCLAPAGPVSADLQSAGVETFACDAEDARDFLALKRLSQHVRQMGPDLIHSTLMHANVCARLVGVVQRVPVVASTATVEVERRWHRAAERTSASMDRAHIVNSQTLAEHVVRAFGISRERVHVVPPSLDPPPTVVARERSREALGIGAHEFVVAWCGRFDPVKRLELVVGVAEIMTRVPTRFLLVGDGPTRGAVEQQLRLSNAGRVVHLLGWQADVGATLSAADAFLFPSLTEGMPNAVLEAMYCGLPVVGSDIAVLRELAGEEGRLLTVGEDEPRAYAEVLLGLREDAGRRVELGQRAAEWARANLNPEATTAAVLEVYRKVLREKR